MKAIELNSRTDKNGYLKIKYPLEESEKNVRVLILMEEDNNETDEEELWIKAISQNPAFDFLKDESEDIYSLADGEPFND